MKLKAGILQSAGEYEDSMAKAIEYAFLQEWPKAMKGQDPPTVNDQMRLLFVAIAQGVVRHLVDNIDAFTVIRNGAGPGDPPDTVNVSQDGTLYKEP